MCPNPDGAVLVGTVLSFSRDAVGVPKMDLQESGTVRWQSGPG